MKQVKVELNHAGIADVLDSEEVKALLSEIAGNAHEKLLKDDEGYSMKVKTVGSGARRRAIAVIQADSFRARHHNLKNNTILKSLR